MKQCYKGSTVVHNIQDNFSTISSWIARSYTTKFSIYKFIRIYKWDEIMKGLVAKYLSINIHIRNRKQQIRSK